MESPGTTSAPAAGGGSPAPSTPAPSAPSAPASSTPSSSAPYGSVPKDSASAIFDKIDADLAAKANPAAAPAETPEATPATLEEPAVDPTATPTADPQATENEASLPPSLRESLKNITDPAMRRYLADSAFMRREVAKTNLPFATAIQFLKDAPRYLQKAPSLDVLDTMSKTAGEAEAIAAAFTESSPEGYQNFTKALVQSDPNAFVGYVGFLLSDMPKLARTVSHYFGAELGQQMQAAIDASHDGAMRNVIARMRRDATQPDKEVYGEVADELEKYLGLNEAPKGPRQPDPRDLEIQRLRAERSRASEEARDRFTSGVVNQAGNVIDKSIHALVIGTPDKPGNGAALPAKAQQAVITKIGERLYAMMLPPGPQNPEGNPEIARRVNAINAAGKWDGAHAKQLHDFYTTAANRLMPAIAAEELRNMAELTGTSLAKREQKVQAQLARRDTGASGSPVAAPTGKPVIKPGMSNKEIFAELDRAAGDAA